jgi:hypothetical protein
VGLTKITAPLLRDVLPRARLFSLLDELSNWPVTWLSSPAGSGKTTLLTSYLREKKIPFIWYRVDETDNDVANFFYYMSEAVKKLTKGRNKPLPLFTPEYHLGMFAFTCHYFESLFSRLTPPYAIVLDNYQDAPEQSPFHELVRNGLGLVPEGIRIFVESRSGYPPAFVSLKVRNMLACVGWEDIRFTLDEVRQMISRHRKAALPEEIVHRIYTQTRGWAASMVLLSEQEQPYTDQQPVFDYIAVEIFRKLPEHQKTFLLKTSLLPSVSPLTARRLTGMEESETILSGLGKNYFTERYGGEYSYHPLFRDFLLSEAKKTYKDEFSSLVLVAGQILAESGQAEQAVKLLLDAGAYEEALPLIVDYAPELVKQGRTATLEEWAERLPRHIKDSTPWLIRWLGMGRLISDPGAAKICFEKAFGLFEAAGDQTGCLVAAADIINSIILEMDDYRPLDVWIDWIDQNVGPLTQLASPDIEAIIASAMVSALWRRQPWHADTNVWIERVVRSCAKIENILVRFTTIASLMDYYGTFGYFEEMRLLAEEFGVTKFLPHMPPLVHLTYMVRVYNLYDWISGSPHETIRFINKAIAMAEKMGAYSYVGAMYVEGIQAALEIDDLELAARFVSKAEQSVSGRRSSIHMRFSARKSFYLFRKGKLSEARSQAEAALALAEIVGAPTYEAFGRLILAYVLRLQGSEADARYQVEKVKGIIAPIGPFQVLNYLVLLTEAMLALDKKDRSKCLNTLMEAFGIGRVKGYAQTFYWWWQPAEMARLCAEALAAGIEVEYSREVVKAHMLTPPEGPLENLMQWPWPVRIHSFGCFQIEVEEKPLTFAHKVQKKPLALLKAIVALDGRDVSGETLEDILWPEAEGDSAHIAFKSAVFRLRRLLGDERAIRIKEGRISLNPEIVWLDTWAFESLAVSVSRLYGERGSENTDKVNLLVSLVLDLYAGDFLSKNNDLWADHCCKRLRTMFTRTIERLTEMLDRVGDSQRASYLRETALERGAVLEKPRG